MNESKANKEKGTYDLVIQIEDQPLDSEASEVCLLGLKNFQRKWFLYFFSSSLLEIMKTVNFFPLQIEKE